MSSAPNCSPSSRGWTTGRPARRVLPSLTTLHGLIRHLTKVEHVWFVQVLAGLDSRPRSAGPR